MKAIRIDLSSDTVTKPTQAMRQAICTAEVGDEQQREDPTVNRLIASVCELLGKEDALFLPSGTMCNQIALRVYCRPGDEIILDRTAHTRHYETGGPAALSGATMFQVEGQRGIFTARQCEAAVRPADSHFPRSRVVVVEQTSNLGGGSIWPLETIQEVCACAEKHGLARHMDGARLMNAVVATSIPACTYAACVDSVWIDFSKGLGAPVGAALAGSTDFIQEARRWKHQFGGAMRQAGIIAAGAVYALAHNIERLAEDHMNAQILARGLDAFDGIRTHPVETNMVYFDVSGLALTASALNEAMLARGVRFCVVTDVLLRAVTHLDVTRSDIEAVLSILAEIVTP
jgi:threonine aldolase